jgi:hypothetical protein
MFVEEALQAARQGLNTGSLDDMEMIHHRHI